MKKLFRLKEDKRVLALRSKIAGAPGNELTDEKINPSKCVHCGAELPYDVAFQEYHMERAHGLVV